MFDNTLQIRTGFALVHFIICLYIQACALCANPSELKAEEH